MHKNKKTSSNKISTTVTRSQNKVDVIKEQADPVRKAGSTVQSKLAVVDVPDGGFAEVGKARSAA